MEEDIKLEDNEDVKPDVRMGEDDEAMAYDEDLIFKHLWVQGHTSSHLR